MSRMNNEIAKLSERDTYSLIFFALYKLRSIPEYSVLGELACILDKDAMLNLCEYFGGLTIRIPTIDELESIVHSLVLYQKVDIEGEKYEDVVKILGCDSSELRQVKADYDRISKLLQQYNFDRSTDGSK